MADIMKEQIRLFRIHRHHLDTWYERRDVETITGACGIQNSPPGAWETALHNRIKGFSRDEMRQLLEVEKTLLQAWSIRGVPLIFPEADSDAYLSALVPEEGEPWIYTRGIQLALDFLQMPFGELLELLREVMEKLEGETFKSKTLLDQSLAQRMQPLLPADKRELWSRPSMYGNPDKQTVGGAVVSFLLRPCAFMGLIVFGIREGVSPTFTSYKSWLGRSPEAGRNALGKLVKNYLRCYGPGTLVGFTDWLGCSPAQAGRMWQTIEDELLPVTVSGKERYLLSCDKDVLMSPPLPERSLHLLGGHDPYLGLQDREIILKDRALQKQVWQTVSNPGVLLCQGAVAGMWKSRKKGKGLELELALWDKDGISKEAVQELAVDYALFQGLKLERITFV